MKLFIVLLIKILCVWLIIHFLVHTRVTFGLWIDGWAIRAWKELLIGVLTLIAWFFLVRWTVNKEQYPRLFRYIIGLLLIGIVWTFIIHTQIVWGSIRTRAMAMRYDYLWFVVLVVWWIVSRYLWSEQAKSILSRYGRVIKRVLLLALLVRCVVAIKPWTMKLFWFNNYVFEGTVGMQPPAVYYTHINYGLPRSQFFFERPTTFWFWLTAFFPLFFFLFLYRRPRTQTRARWTIYGLNVILTFSRAAWWSWIIIVVLCLALTTKLPWKKLLLHYGLPLLCLFWWILILWWEQIALRWYSNYGHMTMVKRGVEMVIEKPLRWWWWASAWPWSHRDWWVAFNPENQFLQIIIEFGKIGALPWLLLWTIVCFIWFSREWTKSEWIQAFSLGMITLTISGMVLHSFGDRMVVLPFMLLFGVALATWKLQKNH